MEHASQLEAIRFKLKEGLVFVQKEDVELLLSIIDGLYAAIELLAERKAKVDGENMALMARLGREGK